MRGIVFLWLCACSQGGREVGTTGTTGGQRDLSFPPGADLSGLPSADVCVTDPRSCYTVYAHSVK